MVVAHKSVHALTNHSQTFLDHFLEGATDAHDFANRFHGRTDETAHTGELGKVPTRYLTDHVVQLRSCISRVGSTHLTNLVEGIA